MRIGPRVALLSACCLWAVSFIATKTALDAVPPLVVVTLRLAVSAVCFLAWGIAARKLLRPLRLRTFLRLAGLSVFGTGLHYGLQTIGLQYTTASNGALYAITAPITIALLAAVLLRERLSPRKTAGIALAICGVVTVIGYDHFLSFSLRDGAAGDLLVMASIVMWALFTVLGKRITDELGALFVTAWVTLIGAVTMVPIGLLEASQRSFALASVPARAWFAIGFLGVGCSFLATLLYFVALEKTESQKVGVYLYTIPPMTAVVAHFYLGEELGLRFFAGAALVLVGVHLTESAASRVVQGSVTNTSRNQAPDSPK